jgi:hypothetical protein
MTYRFHSEITLFFFIPLLLLLLLVCYFSFFFCSFIIIFFFFFALLCFLFLITIDAEVLKYKRYIDFLPNFNFIGNLI